MSESIPNAPFIPDQALLDGVLACTSRAAALVREGALKPRRINKKGRIDLVTETDLAVEGLLLEELSKLAPKAGFLAEESATDFATGELTFVIDPVDGTTNFAHGMPAVAVSVALCSYGDPVLAVVEAPLLRETYWAVKGGGAFLNGRQLGVSDTNDPVDALVATGMPYDIERFLPRILDQLDSVLRACQGMRRYGAAALDLAFVASGRLDAFFEFALKPWDTAAGMLLVTEAGGKVTRQDLSPYSLGDVDILATNGLLHPRMSHLIAGR